ncbi:glycyl-radical enzyme activating protein [Collinsella sp. AGMB00827]|uniref:Glycyl-radical enzyme activating protein n=1 Tax=Collinsella ureilytica TaxID=2869515 RepID=A0ABS7MJF2_9ACTN|nr:glycyl-radical enzyme activating protein [Collinsella urealyticum]MBY4797215.1 glycyl-radical enzyme activating protein [Collinsella urealyticum]
MKGVVFDIRRFSTHDGSGLRTSVFLKGCPLRCVWCQNPEGLDPHPSPVWFAEPCIGCGTCIALSASGGVRVSGHGIALDPHADEAWDALMHACPTGALRWDSQSIEASELADELERDRVFFRDQGGVTLSGGEPLMQADFAAELLGILRARGIHTAIETSLAAPSAKVQRVLPLVDEIFCDYKLADDELHRRLVGASNQQILKNLSWLLHSSLRDRVTVRTPLIPTMTATEENLAAIGSDLVALYPNVRVELLNYNPLAAAKYRDGQRSYCFSDEENPQLYSKEAMHAFGEVMKDAGVRNLIIEA